MFSVSNVVNFLAFLTLASHIGLVVGVVVMWWWQRGEAEPRVIKTLYRYALPAAFLVALTATTGSLFLSEVAGWEPCKLCWYQRVFMYPQVILLGLALWKKGEGARDVAKYVTALALVGAAVSIYHYYTQRMAVAGCSLDGGVDCGVKYIFHYGYITIPVMALTAFLLITVAMLFTSRPRPS